METTPQPLSPEDYLALVNRKIGAEVRERREALHISAYALASKSGVTDQTILNMEQGLTTPNLATLVWICVRFGTTLEEFIVAAMRRPDCPKSLG